MLGISKDPPPAQKKFKEKHQLPFPLLSDADTKVQQAWGVWKEKLMYGKRVMGTERTTVVVGRDGKVASIHLAMYPSRHCTTRGRDILAKPA